MNRATKVLGLAFVVVAAFSSFAAASALALTEAYWKDTGETVTETTEVMGNLNTTTKATLGSVVGGVSVTIECGVGTASASLDNNGGMANTSEVGVHLEECVV